MDREKKNKPTGTGSYEDQELDYSSSRSIESSFFSENHHPLNWDIQSPSYGQLFSQEIQIYSPQELFIDQRFIMGEKKIPEPSKNTPRFLIRLFLKYFREFKDSYPEQLFKILDIECQKLKEWSRIRKKNVFGIKHLTFFFSDVKTFTPRGVHLNRKIFRQILEKYGRSEMQGPLSQIGNKKAAYALAIKVFSLRCMSSSLAKRNQIR